MRGKDEQPRGPRGMKYRRTPAETDLFCPGCLSQVILDPFIQKAQTFLCERCKKISIRKKVLSFDDMVTEKFNRQKTKARCENA